MFLILTVDLDVNSCCGYSNRIIVVKFAHNTMKINIILFDTWLVFMGRKLPLGALFLKKIKRTKYLIF